MTFIKLTTNPISLNMKFAVLALLGLTSAITLESMISADTLEDASAEDQEEEDLAQVERRCTGRLSKRKIRSKAKRMCMYDCRRESSSAIVDTKDYCKVKDDAAFQAKYAACKAAKGCE